MLLLMFIFVLIRKNIGKQRATRIQEIMAKQIHVNNMRRKLIYIICDEYALKGARSTK